MNYLTGSPLIKDSIVVSINPTYYCNLRCSFCYLTSEQLGDKSKIHLDVLNRLLNSIETKYRIETVDLYGGEVFLLKEPYLDQIVTGLSMRGIVDINVITNLTTSHPMVNDPRLNLYVSYDMSARERHLEVYEKMSLLTRPFSILMLVSKEVLEHSPEYIISKLNDLPNLMSFELKPYSKNQSNNLDVSNVEFEEFVKEFIELRDTMDFKFDNILRLDTVVRGLGHSLSDGHVYITPDGTLAVLDFDDSDREMFLPLDSIESYERWTLEEFNRTSTRLDCMSCRYDKKCLSEHLRIKAPINDSCDGFINLIEWYQER